MLIGRRIREALATHPEGKKTQNWLRLQLGVSQAAVSQWINGSQKPKQILHLAEALRVDAEWLSSGKKAKPSAQFGPDTVPILGHAHGASEASLLNPDSEIGRAPRHPNQQNLKIAFALYARGESMSPRYLPGELVYVVSGRPVTKGQDCVIELNNGEGYVKTFSRTTEKYIICDQLNPAGEWKRLKADVKSIHLVVGRG